MLGRALADQVGDILIIDIFIYVSVGYIQISQQRWDSSVTMHQIPRQLAAAQLRYPME